MKIFITQPMRGRTDEEILAEREKAIEFVKERYNTDVVIVDSFFQNAPVEVKPLWFLGKSIELLSSADTAVFCNGWEDARGCKIEHECCKEYGVNIVEL